MLNNVQDREPVVPLLPRLVLVLRQGAHGPGDVHHTAHIRRGACATALRHFDSDHHVSLAPVNSHIGAGGDLEPGNGLWSLSSGLSGVLRPLILAQHSGCVEDHVVQVATGLSLGQIISPVGLCRGRSRPFHPTWEDAVDGRNGLAADGAPPRGVLELCEAALAATLVPAGEGEPVRRAVEADHALGVGGRTGGCGLGILRQCCLAEAVDVGQDAGVHLLRSLESIHLPHEAREVGQDPADLPRVRRQPDPERPLVVIKLSSYQPWHSLCRRRHEVHVVDGTCLGVDTSALSALD
mmetsp:Transcript_23879/g.43093  ORF Transcript_23879/g.43093 Transcript_23879/m.43093 type:complete len:295 (+) Transcript_23879:2611-3495(+)